MNEWTIERVENLASSVSITHSFNKEKLVFLNTSDIFNGKLLHHEYSPVNNWPGQAKKSIRKHDILLSEIRPANGRWAYVDIDADDYVVSTKLIVIRAHTERILSRYLYHFLTCKKTTAWLQHLAESRSGTFPQITFREIADLKLALPAIPTQALICEFLDAINDKIELNRQTNETLETLARAIFKDWFVDFGPTRAKADGSEPYLAPELWELFPDALDDEDKPVGWEMRSIYNFAKVVYGAPFASNKFNTDQIGLPLIRIRDLATHEPEVYTDERHPKGHTIEPGDIVVGMDGEFRLYVWKGPKSWLNQRVCHFEPRPGVPASFLMEALKEPLAYFERGKVGTTVIHLGKSDIDTFQLLHVGDKNLLAFSDLAEPLLEQCVNNALESRTLAQTRDLLLPKLMSGEICLQDAERIVGEVV